MITFPLQFILVLIATFLISLILTPFVRLLAFKIDAETIQMRVDQ